LTKLKSYLTYNKSPKLLILEYPYTSTKTSHEIKIKVNYTTTLLYLKGIVYQGKIILHLELYHFVIFERNSLSGENNFTSRIISKDGKNGSMMELQLEAKVLRKAIFLQ
jgi:hypothetical protein